MTREENRLRTREVAELLVGQDIDTIEARLLLWARAVKAAEWADTEKATNARRSPFFFLPCPLCGTWYSGGERNGGSVTIERHEIGLTGMGVCVNCSDDAKRLNARWPSGIKAAEPAQEGR